MNEHDSERIAGVLGEAGMDSVVDPHDADVIVVNTCCIRENAETRLYGELGHLKALKDQRPGMQIAIGGCLAQKDRQQILDRAPWVDVVFGTHNVGRIGELLDTARMNGPLCEVIETSSSFAADLPVRRATEWSAWVAIQIGCDNRCAFCIVPSVRGEELSRPFGDVVNEVREAALRGVTNVTLLGQNVNSYGRDLTTVARREQQSDRAVVGQRYGDEGSFRIRPLFADLLCEVGAIEGIRRIRYMSPHPKDFDAATIAAMARTPAVCEHLHLPLQSGSRRVLGAMHRGYTPERFAEQIRLARDGVDDLAITTDLIVGFPGETNAEFNETCELVEACAFDSAFVFQFSPRDGTEAASMTDQFVDPDELTRRFDILQGIQERSALQRHEERVGRIEEVVVEGVSRRNPGVLNGRTRQNKLVHFEGALAPGSYAEVEITGAAPHYLRGRSTNA